MANAGGRTLKKYINLALNAELILLTLLIQPTASDVKAIKTNIQDLDNLEREIYRLLY